MKKSCLDKKAVTHMVISTDLVTEYNRATINIIHSNIILMNITGFYAEEFWPGSIKKEP